jgi:type IV secretion system protein VirB8
MSDVKNDKLQRELNELREFIEAHDDIQAALANSAAWHDSQAERDRKEIRTAWRVTGGAGVVAVLAIVVAITAVRTAYVPPPPPEVLLMNKVTGQVEPLVSLETARESVGDALMQHYISEFMRYRENYTYDTAEEGYYGAAAFMSPQLQAQWAAYWDTSNPQSPYNYYKKDATVRMEINSITLNTSGAGVQDTATVRFTRTVKRNSETTVTRWVATIAYMQVNAPVDVKSKRLNPDGLQIRTYQVDPDIGMGGSSVTPASALPTPVSPAVQQGGLVAPRVPVQPASQGSQQ